ncbi:MAG: hypothetical protein ACI9YT_002609 [Halobacteriales archaeon]|jgi:hypothetical protein
MIRKFSPRDVRALFGFGVAVWLIATVVFRVGGPVLFDPDAPLIVCGVFAVAVPATIIVTFAAFLWR